MRKIKTKRLFCIPSQAQRLFSSLWKSPALWLTNRFTYYFKIWNGWYLGCLLRLYSGLSI